VLVFVAVWMFAVYFPIAHFERQGIDINQHGKEGYITS
jgi:hypothetical protein